MPRYLFPRVFDLGDPNHPAYYVNTIYHGDIIWALVTGMLLASFLICYGEYFTSHAFKPTRDVARETNNRSSMGIITSFIYASNFQFLFFFALILAIMISYSIGGFYCTGLSALGLMSSSITLLSINFLSGIINDSYQCAKITRTFAIVKERIYKIAWCARNYSIYIQIVNAGGVFLANLVCIGCILVLTKISEVWMWSGFTLFGFLYGASFAYFLKGGSIWAVKNVAEDIYSDFQCFEGGKEMYPPRIMNRTEHF